MTARPAALLPAAVTLARRAGDVILAVRAAGFTPRRKADGTPVTDADLRAEEVIVGGLAALAPEFPVVSEERAASGDVPDISGGSFWLVDPLDGTRDFIAGGAGFCVAIGLVRRGRPVLGVLHGPAAGVTYAAAAGTATAGRAAGTMPAAARRPPRGGLRVLTSRRRRDGSALDRILAGAQVARRVAVSSALKFGDIAEGRADLYVRPGPTMEWDTAAGQAVLEAAGGRVRTLAGGRLRYGKPGFRNAGFVARGRQPLPFSRR